jgi:trans-2,3-dihydro-3-hydroxyanthranilate isomerase
MARYRFLTADVFTDRPFGGNQLAVFPDALEIPESRLLDVAREFNYSETTFVYPPSGAHNTRRVRIFTPGGEVPFAGHPTVGTAHVLAAIGEVKLTGDVTKIVFEEKVGPVPVAIRAERGVPTFAQLTAAKLPQAGPTPPSNEKLAEVLGLQEDELLTGDWMPRGYTCGLPFLFVPVRDRGAVRRAHIRLDAWEKFLRETWAPEVFVFAAGGERPGSDYHARLFAPGLSVPEDPATGSACAALAGYLSTRDPRAAGEGTARWVIEQGFEMGRPSIIELELERKRSSVTAVRVGGASVVVSEGEMEISV